MSSGFITETEIEERKKVRQAEWDKVRKPEDPEVAPEEALQPTDHRSLFDRLQEQKMRKQEEFEEAHKLKNLVKGLDDDEADFLEYVDKSKMDLERQKQLEERKELLEFRSKIAELHEQDLNKHIQQELGLVKSEKKPSKTFVDELPSIGTRKITQSKLLAGIVRPKSSPREGETVKKPKLDESAAEGPSPSTAAVSSKSEPAPAVNSDSNKVVYSVPYKGSLVCIGVLPGLASYSDSSNSDDNSSDSEHGDDIPRDLCGRQLVEASHEESEGKKKK